MYGREKAVILSLVLESSIFSEVGERTHHLSNRSRSGQPKVGCTNWMYLVETNSGPRRESRCQSQLQPVAKKTSGIIWAPTSAEGKYLDRENGGMRGRNAAKRCFSYHCISTLPLIVLFWFEEV